MIGIDTHGMSFDPCSNVYGLFTKNNAISQEDEKFLFKLPVLRQSAQI